MKALKNKQSQSAFTLIELLVVIFIIAVLVGLLLPAVQKIRETASKLICSNNLKQIGLAINNFNDTYLYYPHAGVCAFPSIQYDSSGIANGPTRQPMGWLFLILPFIEQENIYKVVDNSIWPNTGPVASKPIKLYFCPSRRSPAVSPNGRAMNDYAAAIPGIYVSNGVQAPFSTIWPVIDMPVNVMDEYSPFPLNFPDHGGILNRGRRIFGSPGYNVTWPRVTPLSVTDGTTSTILIGEKFKKSSRYYLNDGHDDQGWVCGWDYDTVRTTCVNYKRDTDQISVDDDLDSVRFGSPHVNGMNALFGDGSIRSINYSINPNVFWRLGQRNDGDPINFDF